MALSRDEINNLARLSRIGLDATEEERFGAQLSSILEYVDVLKSVDTTGVQYQYHVPGLSGVTRPDEVRAIDETEREEIINAFPAKQGDLLSVKKIF